ncbi:hypothetical protein K470DRAFT_270737 [Piedraia hortae CBS 480.64]|uniref:Uncharacterized protein n=1 Tax=Piedraia hortae CBS 480.64 TaxID=1314780 RepID=A0A6A7BYR9_9PEZI|nr:hypothetical protein K470DRAFT_270737 [Piedraia hortae CBS 480.64]
MFDERVTYGIEEECEEILPLEVMKNIVEMVKLPTTGETTIDIGDDFSDSNLDNEEEVPPNSNNNHETRSVARRVEELFRIEFFACVGISSGHTEGQALQRSVTVSTPHRRPYFVKPLPPLPVAQPAARPRHSPPPSSSLLTPPPKRVEPMAENLQGDHQRKGRITLALAELDDEQEPAINSDTLDCALDDLVDSTLLPVCAFCFFSQVQKDKPRRRCAKKHKYGRDLVIWVT